MRDVHVYFIQAGGETGPIKIGHAVDVRKRMEMLQTGNDKRLSLLFSLLVGERELARAMELAMHAMFDDLRIGRSEWFAFSQDILDTIEIYRRIDSTFRGQPVVIHFDLVRREAGGVYMRPRSPSGGAA